jgi:hypothetical protein
MAQVLAAGTGAEAAAVWLRVGELRPAAVWPAGATAPQDDRVEVSYQGVTLGELSVLMPANDPMNPSKRKLVEDLASQAGLVLRNVRLIEELRASRQRLVSTQDEERRKIERNIHDGAQQQLVALAVKQRIAASVVGRDDERARVILEELKSETTQALEDLRDLARGIYPPLLADQDSSPRWRPSEEVGRAGRCDGWRDRALPAADGGGRLLLVPRGSAERRAPLADQETEDAAPTAGRADGRALLGCHARGDELRDRTVVAEHTESPISGAGDLARELHDPLEDGVEGELGGQRQARLDQLVAAAAGHCGGTLTHSLRINKLTASERRGSFVPMGEGHLAHANRYRSRDDEGCHETSHPPRGGRTGDLRTARRPSRQGGVRR